MTEENIGSWQGKPMMNPEGKIGKVINDNNSGFLRILTVAFEDKTKEELCLSNIGQNSKASRKWKWLFINNGKEKWVEWGK